MALDLANLTRAGGGAQQLFVYKTTDAIATVTGSGYFNNATNMLRQHDVIMVVGSTGGTPTVDVIAITSATAAATVTSTATEGVTAT